MKKEHNLNSFLKNIDKYEITAKSEVKNIYNVALTFIFEGLKSRISVAALSKEDAKQLIDWCTNYPLPLFVEDEDYEKCQKIQNAISLLKESKNL